MKNALFLLGLGVLALPLQAFDFGASENEATVLLVPKITAPIVTQTSKTTAYLKVPLGDFALHAEGVADLSLTYLPMTAISATNPSFADPRFDLGLAKLSGLIPLGTDANGKPNGVLSIALGRLGLSDLSGWVLGGKADGATVSYYSGKFHLDLGGWYTGLVLKKNSRVGIGALDSADSSVNTKLFAPSRAIGSLNLGLNEVFLRQDLQWENLAQYDLRSSGALVHSAYSTLDVSGPLLFGFRHETSVTGAVVATDWVPAFGALAATHWSANLPLGRLVLDGAWARGFDDKSDFVALAGKGMASVTSLPSYNGGMAGADWSFSPAPKVSTGLKADALFRANTARPSGLGGVLAASTDSWLGAEASTYGSWAASAEFNLGWTLGAFVPNPSTVAANTAVTYLAVLTATLEL